MHPTPQPGTLPAPTSPAAPAAPAAPAVYAPQRRSWQERLEHVVQTVREMSLETDPQRIVSAYARRMRENFPLDGSISLSRRGLSAPHYRITRSHLWAGREVNPWKEPHKLPLLASGLLGELLYGDRPRIIDDLRPDPADPAYPHLSGMRSAVALPHYHQGVAMNMVVHLRREPGAFDPEAIPDLLLTSNLFGRATNNLVLAEQLRLAHEAIDAELKVVGDIQRSLLPQELPAIPGLSLAAHYQTSRRAGGDYYDFFPLPDGLWGILLADVSGHGTPAAVVMAITHAVAHAYRGPATPPGELLAYLNQRLLARPQHEAAAFVTAFYGIYDPAARTLTYSSAGHPPPRLRRIGDDGDVATIPLDGAQHLPLGIVPDEQFEPWSVRLRAGDHLLLYTDGINEAFGAAPPEEPRELFGFERLDAVVREQGDDSPQHLIRAVLEAVAAFTGDQPAADDRTLIAALVR